MNDESRIVEATGIATGGKSAADLERAMAKAIEQALAEGVTDPDEIRKRQLAVREVFKKS
jgi:tape measure domain-containing protein